MKYKQLNKIIFEYEQKVFVLLFAVFFIGFLFGSFRIFNSGQSINISGITAQFSRDFYLYGVFIYCAFLILSFMLGFTVFGLPFILFISLLLGLFSGIICCSVTYSYGYVGCFVCSLSMFPFFLILILSLFFISFSSIRLSGALCAVFKNGTRFISPREYLIPHILKFIFFFILTFSVITLYYIIFIPLITKIL